MDVRIKANSISNQYVAESIQLTTSLASANTVTDKDCDRLLAVLEHAIGKIESLSDEDRDQILLASSRLREASGSEMEEEQRQSVVLEFLTLLRKSFGEVADVILTASSLTRAFW